MKPVKKAQLIKWLHSIADELSLPYEERDEEFDDDGAAYTIREAAKFLELYAPNEIPRD